MSDTVRVWPDELVYLDFFGVEPVRVQKYHEMPEYDPVRYTVERNGISLSVTVDSLEASVGLQLMSAQTPIFDAGFDGVVDRIEIEHTRAGRRLLIKTADGLNSIVQVDPEIRLWLQARQIF